MRRLIFVLLLCSCASALRDRFIQPGSFPITAHAHGSGAVYELLEDDVFFSGGDTYLEHRELLKVLDARGLDAAFVRFSIDHENEVSDFAARSVAPDGTIRWLSMQDLAFHGQERANGPYTYAYEFPAVQVGSELEAIFVEHHRGNYTHVTNRVMPRWPVLHYVADVAPLDHATFTMTAYNTTQRAFLQDGHLRFEAHDLPSRPDDPDQPDVSLFATWWQARMTHFAGKNVLSTWADALHGERDELVDKLRARASISFDRGACRDVRCVLEAALAETRRLTEFTGFDSDPRPLTTVLATHSANVMEKAVLLRALLDEAEVRSRLVFLVRPFSTAFDPAFPTPTKINHVVLQVPRQRGLDHETWLDPSCESCAPGVLPAWSAGATGVLVDEDDDEVAKLVVLPADARQAGGITRDIDLVLDAAGNAVATVTTQHDGAEAAQEALRLRRMTAHAREQQAERDTLAIASTATVLDKKDETCATAAGRCTSSRTMSLPAYAFADGDRWIIPLSAMHSGWDDEFPSERREAPFARMDDGTLTERLTIHLPAGCVPEAMPLTQSASGTVLDGAVAVGTNGEVVRIARTLVQRRGMVAADRFPETYRAWHTFSGVPEMVVSCRAVPQPPPELVPASAP